MRRLALITAAAAAAAGCGWGVEPPPRLDGVSPLNVARGVTATVALRGAGFAPTVPVDFDAVAATGACAPVRAELRAPPGTPGTNPPIPLGRLRALSSGELRGHLSGADTAAAAKVKWDVVAIDWMGREAKLPAALEIAGCDSPSLPCDDGEPDCTTADACTGTARCAGAPVAAGTPCHFACPGGATVPGTCQAGICQPDPGGCDSLPVCAAP